MNYVIPQGRIDATSAASGNLIGWWDYGSEVNVTNGNNFVVSLDTSNGILQLA